MEAPHPLDSLIQLAVTRRASDILLSREKVFLRRAREIEDARHPLPPDFPECLFARISGEDAGRVREALSGANGAADFALNAGGRRVRANVYHSSEGICAALRLVLDRAPCSEEIDLDSRVVRAVLSKTQGLVLVTGPTGSGKSTTVTALVESINRERAANIITIEDPVEFLYTPRKSTIQQREVGRHVGSFGEAVRSAMRQNPDVIVVGEIRDAETMRAALQAAETGHLVFATLHTKRVHNTVTRLLGFALPSEEAELREVLANNLLAVICQRLFRHQDGHGMVVAREILLHTRASATLIREGKERQLVNVMSTSQTLGMVDYNTSLKRLHQSRCIDESTLRDELDEI